MDEQIQYRSDKGLLVENHISTFQHNTFEAKEQEIEAKLIIVNPIFHVLHLI